MQSPRARPKTKDQSNRDHLPMLTNPRLCGACAGVLLILFFSYPMRTQIASRDRILRPINSSETAMVAGSVHPLVRSQPDKGRTALGTEISGASLVFKLSAVQQADLNHLLRDQLNSSSPRYHRWLTPEQYGHRFGMSDADLAKVQAWLQSQSLRIEGVSTDRNQIFFSGSVAQMERAFNIEIHDYEAHSERHFANSGNISLPAAFASEVLAIRGLSNFHPKSHARLGPHFTSSLSGNHFVIPGDFATIYGLNQLYSQGLDGAGEKIAVVGQTSINLTDIRAFRSASGLLANDPTFLLVPGTGASTSCSGDLTEADLDVEWSGGVAKSASVIYVYVGVNSGGTCTSRAKDVFDALQYAINNNIAPVISISYGNCEANIGSSSANTIRQWIQQANAQGQTVVAASGDDGAADCDFKDVSATHGLAVDIPAAIPEVSGIGGTEFTGDPAATVSNGCALATADWGGSCNPASGPSALGYISETVWNDPPTKTFSAGGGGASKFFTKAQAPWQTGPGVPNDGQRDVPDISFNASAAHDPYLFCSGGSCVNGFRDSSSNLRAVGGTSVGAPAFAGIVAIMNQATQSSGQSNVNPNLYSLAVSTPSAFHDTPAPGDNKVPCTKGTTDCPNGGTIGFSAGANYDQASGMGSLDVFNLITSWPGFVSTPTFSVAASPAASTIPAVGQSGRFTVTVSAANGFAGSVALSCAVPANNTTKVSCGVSPASVSIDTTNKTQTATLTVNSLAAAGALPRDLQSGFLVAVALTPIGFLIVLPKRRNAKIFIGTLALSVLGLMIGCGGGGSSHTSTQPQGQTATYAITVTGTNGSTSHTFTVNVTVK